jgi:hypothetical protein
MQEKREKDGGLRARALHILAIPTGELKAQMLWIRARRPEIDGISGSLGGPNIIDGELKRSAIVVERD